VAAEQEPMMEPKTQSPAQALAQERFGAFAATYATSIPHAKGSSLARLVELAAPQPGWRALDVATGAGHVALALAPHVAAVVASDITPQMLAVARGIANITFVDAQAEALPFADASFDLVTCRIAPHHFDDVPGFVREAARVLRPGGLFGLVDNISPDPSMMAGDAATLAAAAADYNAIEKLRDPSHGRCLTLAEWREIIASAGLRERTVELIDKAMVFGPWADQQKVSAADKATLKARLMEGSPALRAFLRAREEKGDIGFVLTEALIIAVK
jgi:SAM-dependent methyltransferase